MDTKTYQIPIEFEHERRTVTVTGAELRAAGWFRCKTELDRWLLLWKLADACQ